MNFAAVRMARAALLQADMAIAIAVHPVGDDVAWQHLHLADFAGPCAGVGGRV
jgi:hypothetical protein